MAVDINGATATYTVMNPGFRGVYVFSLSDTPGVAAANNFVSLFNPVGSGRVLVFGGAFVSSWSNGAITTPASMVGKRITTATGGTLQNNNTAVAEFLTSYPAAVAELRTGNPATTNGASIFNSPPIQSNPGSSAVHSVLAPPGSGAFVMNEGEGIALSTATGDVDMRWNISIVWAEI